MAANGLSDVSALVFNTHGESMGRGAHPASFRDRLEWPLSPWARRRFARAGIRLEPEVSFQGGDGTCFLPPRRTGAGDPVRIAELRPAETDMAAPGPIRSITATPRHQPRFSTRAIKEYQGDFLASRTYSRAVTAFGLGLLNPTGSRAFRAARAISMPLHAR